MKDGRWKDRITRNGIACIYTTSPAGYKKFIIHGKPINWVHHCQEIEDADRNRIRVSSGQMA